MAITNNRTALIQAVGGFGIVVGVIAGAFTLRHNRQQLRLSHQEFEKSLAASRKEHEETLADRLAFLDFDRQPGAWPPPRLPPKSRPRPLACPGAAGTTVSTPIMC